MPDRGHAEAYHRLYGVYSRLHDWFGRDSRDLMGQLQTIRDDATRR